MLAADGRVDSWGAFGLVGLTLLAVGVLFVLWQNDWNPKKAWASLNGLHGLGVLAIAALVLLPKLLMGLAERAQRRRDQKRDGRQKLKDTRERHKTAVDVHEKAVARVEEGFAKAREEVANPTVPRTDPPDDAADAEARLQALKDKRWD